MARFMAPVLGRFYKERDEDRRPETKAGRMAILAQRTALYWEGKGLHNEAVKLIAQARHINDFSGNSEVQLGSWETDDIHEEDNES